MKAPRYGPFLHGEWRPSIPRSRPMHLLMLPICFIPSFMESFISSSLTRLVTSDEPSVDLSEEVL